MQAVEHIASVAGSGTSPAFRDASLNRTYDMIPKKARMTLQAAALGSAMLLAPMATHAQNTDSTAAGYATTDTDNDGGFDWGWLGLLGLLGLIPRKRKIETVETRTTTGTTGTTGSRY